jgi:hypothetical protein
MRGQGTDAYYVVEVDPATGDIPVSLSGGSIAIDFSGPTGDPVPADAGFMGGVDSNGDLRGISVDTAGVVQTNEAQRGQENMAGSIPVVIASDQSAIDVNITTPSSTYADSVRYDYTGGSVTTGAWVEIEASTAAPMDLVCITDQSGQIMLLGTGAAAAETTVFMIARGFSGCVPLTIASGTRLSLRAVSATASTGDFVLSGINQ